MNENKSLLRNKYKSLRAKFLDTEIDDQSLAIANNVMSLPIWEKNYYHIFLPILAMKEVNTENILHLLAGKDKDIVVSKSDFTTRDMRHYLLTDNTKIKTNQYGIPEPVDGLEVPVAKIDVVFVPLLAYDSDGHRVGYGKGFYDKFLAQCKPDVIKIGLSFFAPEQQLISFLPTDIRLNYCVTPTEVYSFA